MSRKKYLIGAVIVFIGAILFSAKAVLIKLAYRHPVDAISLLTLRMLMALPFYLLVNIYLSSKTRQQKLTEKAYLSVIILGVSGYYLASFFDFYGLKFITASLERLILFIYPTFVVIITALVFKKAISWLQILAIFMTYAGILVIVTNDLNMEDQKDVWLGGGLILLSALTFAIYLVGSGEIIPKIGSLRFTAMAMSVSAVCVILHYLVGHSAAAMLNFPREVYWLSLIIALFCTVLPSFLLSEGILRIGSSNASIIGGIGPVSTIVLAYFFLGERITWMQIIGTVFVIAGVLVISLKNKK
ncbi:DMT family transporter [Fulvivirgaceae bacterium BMA12]|uniref:DMT family transporter n=1 Tax=Agaribacillus aureus TaxID=3051825 RepID=A0ABT8LGQ5_9BACT|nr:DMT family transporter [Fulvivirgaceae bacterium BMA12]